MLEKLKESDKRKKKDVRVQEAINSTQVLRAEAETQRNKGTKERTLRKKNRHSEASSHVIQNDDTLSTIATEVSLVTGIDEMMG